MPTGTPQGNSLMILFTMPLIIGGCCGNTSGTRMSQGTSGQQNHGQVADPKVSICEHMNYDPEVNLAF